MNPDRARRLRELFAAACERSGDERERLLDRECGGDDVLREEVESLLRRDAREDNPLDGPFLREPDACVPDRIGAFRVTHRIDSGSTGTVYAGEQDHPARAVAIKVLRPGVVDEETRRRFRLEVDILGRLRHENIARIFEAGEVDLGHGLQPFLVMERIDGVSPLEFARTHDLGIEERIRLLATICDGVGHAHARGVIHRDLKGQNILVDAAGQPRIVDFGIARRLDDESLDASTRHTRAGQLLGTIEAMSPEQARGDSHAVDTRSDVYALGVIGYELLAGRPPYALNDLDLPDALRVVRDTSPPPLGRDDPALRGDLEVVLGKALRKDPERRYASASELADELRRCLHDEPIIARPPSTRHQLARFARQHRAFVVGGGAVAIASVISVVVIGLAFLETRRSERARAAALEESEAVTRFLEELLASADPALRGADVLVKDVLADASSRVASEFEERPALAGRLLATNGAAFSSLGDYEAAERDLRDACRRLELGKGARDPATLVARRRLALVISDSGRHDEALELLRTAWVDTLDALGPRAEASLESGIDLAAVELRALDVESAIERLRPLLEECVDVLGEEHVTTNAARLRLGKALLKAGDLDGARERIAEVLRIRLVRLGETHHETRDVRALLAFVHLRQGRFAEARELHEGEIRVYTEVFGEEHPRTLGAISRHAQFLGRQTKFGEALPFWRRSLDGFVERLGEPHPFSVDARIGLGSTLLNLGRLEEAEPIVVAARDLARATFGERDSQTIVARATYAGLLRAKWDTEGSLAESLEVLALSRSAGVDPQQLVESLYNISLLELELARFGDAEGHLGEARAIADERLGSSHPSALMSRSLLARVYSSTERHEEAMEILEEVCPRLREVVGPRHARTIYADYALAGARFECGREELAIEQMVDVLTRCAEVMGAAHENTVSMTLRLAGYQAELERSEDAEATLLARVAACEGLPPSDQRILGLARQLASVYASLGRVSDAAAWAARANP